MTGLMDKHPVTRVDSTPLAPPDQFDQLIMHASLPYTHRQIGMHTHTHTEAVEGFELRALHLLAGPSLYNLEPHVNTLKMN
jgi:hypothetical protein